MAAEAFGQPGISPTWSSSDKDFVTTALGGKEGGGAKLTPFGQNLLKHYRAIETEAATAAKKHIAFLARSLSEKPPAEAKRTRISK